MAALKQYGAANRELPNSNNFYQQDKMFWVFMIQELW